MSYLLAILGLAVLIVVHEAGHMWVARWCRMRVEKFSIFFGPALLRWQRGETTYQIASVPLGGYVQIAGMNPDEELPPDDPGSYQSKGPGRRFLTIFAGPAINYVFAIVVMLVVTLFWGAPHQQLVVAEVEAKGAAAAGGMRPGDRFVAVDGAPLDGVADVLKVIRERGGLPLRFELEREGGSVTVTVTPQRSGDSYRIGIRFGQRAIFRRIGLGASLAISGAYPFVESARVLSGLKRLLTGEVSTDQVGGPVEIVRQLKMSFETSAVMALLFLAMLNVYLGLFNLLPLPALDGGRLVFLVWEMATRRPVNKRVEAVVHTVGFVLLFGLLLLVTLRDVKRLL